MATQYIGARYVPRFYTASDDSNNWEAGVQYEALTVVMYLNQSYTSKIPVPASVGNPADNPTYWVMTGAYNAQVQAYKDAVDLVVPVVGQHTTEIDDLDTRVTDLETTSTGSGRCVWIGDSYVQANSLGADQDKRFSTLVSNNLGLTEHNYAVGGSGFLAPAGSTYYEQIIDAVGDLDADQRKEVKFVFICGGRNDPYNVPTYTLAALNTAVSDCYQKVWDEFPNAQIVGVPMLWDFTALNTTYQTYLQQLTNCMQNQNGGKQRLITNAYTYLLGRIGTIISGDVHPNVTGHSLIAIQLTQEVLGGLTYRYPTLISKTGNDMTVKILLLNDIVQITIDGTPTSAMSFGSYILNSVQLGANFGVITQTNYFVPMVARDGSAATIQIGFYSSGGQIVVTAQCLSNAMSVQEWHGEITFPNGFMH